MSSTPGPWKITDSEELVAGPEDGFEPIGTCGCCSGYWVKGATEGEKLANARLIAAAPELADALEAVLDNVPTCVFVDAYPWDGRCGTHDFTVQEPGKCAVQRASEVLRRTRGES